MSLKDLDFHFEEGVEKDHLYTFQGLIDEIREGDGSWIWMLKRKQRLKTR